MFNRCNSQEYISGHARIDMLASGGYTYPKKGIGNIYGSDYEFLTWPKLKGISIICAASLIDGIHEGWIDDHRMSFERKGWTNDPYSYLGSKSWDSNWSTWEKFKGSQDDFNHHAKYARKLGHVTGGYMLGMAAARSNTRKIHGVFDIVLVMVAQSGFHWLGYHWVRDRIDVELF